MPIALPPGSGELERVQFRLHKWRPAQATAQRTGRCLMEFSEVSRCRALGSWGACTPRIGRRRPCLLGGTPTGWASGTPGSSSSKGPWVWYRVIREIVTIERMHRAFARGLMEYGMARAVKQRGAGSEGQLDSANKIPAAVN